MLGHRGVRLGITYPEITEMQTRAIIEAACRLNKEGLKVVPEIMIPLVGHVKELKDQKAVVDRVAAEIMKEQGVKIKYLVGTMIEVPRGAVTADQVAQEAQFFSFGTNDLTQLTFGFSRDDVGKFLRDLPGQEDPGQGSVRDDRRRGRRRRRPDRRASTDARRSPTSRSASAASTAAIRRPSTSSRRSGWTTSAARRTVCRWRGWPPRRRRCRSRSATDAAALGFGLWAPGLRQALAREPEASWPEA